MAENPGRESSSFWEAVVKKCWMVKACSRPADTYLCAPGGIVIGMYCREHAEAAVVEYREKLGEIWSTEKAESARGLHPEKENQRQ